MVAKVSLVACQVVVIFFFVVLGNALLPGAWGGFVWGGW